jgi:serine O-acetyltransferase
MSYRLTHHQANWHRLLRRAEFHTNKPPTPMGRVTALWTYYRFMTYSERLGYTVPLNTFGPGLSIAHKGTVIVNENVRAGRNCRLHPDCTIGDRGGRSPVLGDEVWVGAGARILGNLSIGDGAAVGANAVVLSDVAPKTTVVGIPARPVSGNGSAGLLRGLPPITG